MITKQVYIAFDGTEFDSLEVCIKYENSHTLTQLMNEYFPGQSSDLKLKLCEFIYKNRYAIQEALFGQSRKPVEFIESVPKDPGAIDIFSGDYDDDKEEKHAII